MHPPSSPFNSILERVVRRWHSNAYSSLFSSLFFFDFHRTNFSRFRRTFHSFDPVGFAIFANPAPTQPRPLEIGDGDQFGSGFVTINPNSKIPALLDRSGPTPIRVFESGAILLYLAEKFGAFLPTDTGARAECLSWLLLTRCDYFNGYPAVALAPSLSRSEHPHLEGIQAERQPPTAGVVDRAIGKRSHFPYLRDRQGPPRPVRHVI